MANVLQKVGNMVSDLKIKEGVSNAFLMLILNYLDDLLLAAASQTSSPEGHKLVRVGARTVLNLEWKLRQSVNVSPTQFDDKILDEFIEACKEIEPGYSPVQ